MTRRGARTKLSVNVNKVATLRNSRGGRIPSVIDATRVVIAAGAPGITVHPRADARHITFTDVREIQRQLKSAGLTLATEADESTTGPASLVLVDPDGNPVLIDQHV